ncbi:MAG TPA: hypothetical protein VM050_08390 [Patescibacteria group bacterium]|nr:hypothetical protein [Patescibacteria group bacterium]
MLPTLTRMNCPMHARKRFLPKLEKIEAPNQERKKIEHFLKENIRYYMLIQEYVSMLFDNFMQQDWKT